MAREGRTLTRTMKLESRQYEVLGIELGEGVVRGAMIFGALVVVGWCGLLLVLFGLPNRRTFTFYSVPPLLLAAWGWREGLTHPRRRRVTEWAIAARWIITGWRPVVALGRREANADERRPTTQRIAERLGPDDPLLRAGRKARLLAGRHARRQARRSGGVGKVAMGLGSPVRLVSGRYIEERAEVRVRRSVSARRSPGAGEGVYG